MSTVAKQVLADWQRGKLPFYVLPPGCQPPAPSLACLAAQSSTAESSVIAACSATIDVVDADEAPEWPGGPEDLEEPIEPIEPIEPNDQKGEEQEQNKETEEGESADDPLPHDSDASGGEAEEEDEFQALGRLLADASPDTYDDEEEEEGEGADVDHCSPKLRSRDPETVLPTRQSRRRRPAPAKRESFFRKKPAIDSKFNSSSKFSK